ncbi:DNA repair protein RecO [Patescibacteria group bacterium]|nr:DNA repair protein RecO [Patescibacteria group bacterium]
MEESGNTKAIILDSRAYRENDVLLSVFTLDFGRLNLVVRGAKKNSSKMIGHLEPLTRAKIMIIKGRGFDYVGGALGENSFQGIREDLNKLFYAGKIISLFSRLVKEGEKDERLFLLLNHYLELIDKDLNFNKDEGELFFLKFSLSFLSETGYKPEMGACLKCQAKLEKGLNYFDLQAGGVVCGKCVKIELNNFKDRNKEEKLSTTNQARLLTISNNCVIIIRYLLDLDNKLKIRVSKRVIKEASDLIKKFILYLS